MFRRDPLSRREVRRTLSSQARAFGAYQRGDVVRAMGLDSQLQAMYDRQEAEYQRRYGRDPRAQSAPPRPEQEAQAASGQEAGAGKADGWLVAMVMNVERSDAESEYGHAQSIQWIIDESLETGRFSHDDLAAAQREAERLQSPTARPPELDQEAEADADPEAEI